MTGRARGRRRLGGTATMVAVAAGLWLAGCQPSGAQGACVMERERPDHPTMFVRHLDSSCSVQEREAQTVRADEIFAAVKSGKGVDIEGAMIVGDLFFDALPQTKVGTMTGGPPFVRDALRARQVTDVRRLAGPLIITRSVLRGAVGTRLKDGYLVVEGPVVLTGTTFEGTVDFSRTIFLQPVECSEAVFLAPVFFIQALFVEPSHFEKTAFGPHARFHRSVFGGPATFLRAGFNGLAEFIEVTFEKEASFSRTYFKMGVGFSGSRFTGVLDFSEALFEREAFFTFAVFDQDAYFRRSTFRGTANFSDAQFKGLDDFSKVMFDVQPSFDRVQFSDIRRSPGGLQDSRIMYGIAAILAVFTILFLSSLRKR